MFELIAQGGQDLVQLVGEAKAAMTVYSVGKQQLGRLMGFIDKSQMENAAKISATAAEKLKRVEEDRITAPSPSMLTPLLEAAVQESRSELQELWAALLANSMIDNGKKVRREYLETVKRLEPVDVLVLKALALPLPVNYNTNHPNAWQMFREDIRAEIGVGPDEWAVSVRTLINLGCVSANSVHLPFLMPYARTLLAACEAP